MVESFPRLPRPLPLEAFPGAPDLLAAIADWMLWLKAERRSSAHTLSAYGRDLALFLRFLQEHEGGATRPAAPARA